MANCKLIKYMNQNRTHRTAWYFLHFYETIFHLALVSIGFSDLFTKISYHGEHCDTLDLGTTFHCFMYSE